MLAQRNPLEAYRRVDFDARVSVADPQELVSLCYEQFIIALGSSLVAHERSDNRLKSESLTRALSSLTALQLGLSGNDGVALALAQFYEAARRAVLDSALNFDAGIIAKIREDFTDVAQSMGQQAALNS